VSCQVNINDKGQDPSTNENVDGHTLLSKALMEGGGDFLLRVLSTALKQVMEAEVSAICGGGHGERTSDRVVSRNGR